MSLKNKLLFNSFMKKTKQRKCRNCKYAYIKGNIFACYKTGYYIEPLHLICFSKRSKICKK